MNKSGLKIVFFGTSDFAVSSLEKIINEGYRISAVITQPDKITGRNKSEVSPPVKISAVRNNIEVFQPTKLDGDFLNKFRDIDPDICIVVAYGKIIPKEYLQIPKYGFLNVHPSLLPKYRGPSPIQTVLLEGRKETGVSIMVVDEKIDHGPVLSSENYAVWPKATSKQLEKELSNLGAELLAETVAKWVKGEIEPVSQDDGKATFTKILGRDDGRIDWNQTAEKIHNQIRALSDEPGVWTVWNKKIINVKTALPGENKSPETPGTVLKINSDIAVATKDNYLILKQVQPGGGKTMDVFSFANGHKDFIGSILE
jgi:methionyl-tRNA formyltransferase